MSAHVGSLLPGSPPWQPDNWGNSRQSAGVRERRPLTSGARCHGSTADDGLRRRAGSEDERDNHRTRHGIARACVPTSPPLLWPRLATVAQPESRRGNADNNNPELDPGGRWLLRNIELWQSGPVGSLGIATFGCLKGPRKAHPLPILAFPQREPPSDCQYSTFLSSPHPGPHPDRPQAPAPPPHACRLPSTPLAHTPQASAQRNAHRPCTRGTPTASAPS